MKGRGGFEDSFTKFLSSDWKDHMNQRKDRIPFLVFENWMPTRICDFFSIYRPFHLTSIWDMLHPFAVHSIFCPFEASPFAVHFMYIPLHLRSILCRYLSICGPFYVDTSPFAVHFMWIPLHLRSILCRYLSICGPFWRGKWTKSGWDVDETWTESGHECRYIVRRIN